MSENKIEASVSSCSPIASSDVNRSTTCDGTNERRVCVVASPSTTAECSCFSRSTAADAPRPASAASFLNSSVTIRSTFSWVVSSSRAMSA